MQTSALANRQRQIRGFVIAWMGLTLVMGALTFAGIYYATGLVNAESDTGSAVNSAALANGAPEESRTSAADTAFDPASVEATPVTAAAAPVADADAPAAAPAAESSADSGADAPAPAAPSGPAGGAPAQDATPVPSPTPLPVDNTQFQLGIQVQSNPDPEIYTIWMSEVAEKLNLNWIKQQVRWEDVEPQPGQYDWTALDVTFAEARKYGVEVMISVVTAPEWAREEGNQALNEVGPPGNPQTYANFLITMMQRYPGQIQAVEVWNEMNLRREWASIYGLSAQNYVTLLQTAYNAIKSVDPGVIVISGALSPTGVNDGTNAYDDFVYMDQLIQAGMLNYADCVGAHHNGYNIGPGVPWNNVPNDPTATFRGPFDNPHHSWSFYSTLHGYAERIRNAGVEPRLCVTEFGWASTEDLTGTPAGFEFANDNTLAEQAQFIGEAIDLMQQWDFVWLAFVWNLNYGAQSGWDTTSDNVPYALLRPEWRPAPAYEVIGSYDFRGR